MHPFTALSATFVAIMSPALINAQLLQRLFRPQSRLLPQEWDVSVWHQPRLGKTKQCMIVPGDAADRNKVMKL
ncbi:hypothetical protein H9L39_17264 [Fusarium oxysporum f. sp. albedinis]|nr:hypothetical protein H9L39_17264 [Fusarium oxysporum f. sp. albedinis]